MEKDEYGTTAQLEHGVNRSAGSDQDSQDADIDEFTPHEQKKIIHRVDRRLVLTCGIMYCISLMDRTNLPAAVIAGLTKELQLNINNRYSIVVVVFFVPYIIFQFPSTVAIRAVGPRRFLAAITLFWGAVMIGFGFSKKYEDLVALRFLLGLLEAGFFPGCVYLLSTWYVRYEVQKRYSVFYLIGCFASALAGILAYGLMQMNGLANLTGWRWIFIMEGILTCLIGLAGYWLLVDFPEQAHKSWSFLNEKEVRFIVARVQKDRGDAYTEPFNLKKFLAAGLDIKIWGFALMFFNSTTLSYAIAYFLPIILRNGMGFSIAASQCLVAPPYALAGILMYSSAWLGDRYHIRGPIIALNAIITLVGLPLMGFHSSNAVRYFGVFLVTAGANANIPAVMTYQANNIRGQWKRALCSASMVGFGGIGGIAGGLVFREQDAPGYKPGIYACIACSLLTLLIVGALSVQFFFTNKRAHRGETVIEGQEAFRYTL
ncbi:MAG: hypothetical protein M1837_007485 [Sclerophora amabilis]|nr:MAG: hypothetical protein M1837_007485 [Sclerophora amabilis]